jgi:hypothetical protein
VLPMVAFVTERFLSHSAALTDPRKLVVALPVSLTLVSVCSLIGRWC